MSAGLGKHSFMENILEGLSSRKIKEDCVKLIPIFRGGREVLFMSDCLLHLSSMQTGRQLFIPTALSADQDHTGEGHDVFVY